MVVTLERGEDVGVSLECGEAVLGEIACATTGFACFLDCPSGMPRVGGLESGGATFEFALLLRIRVVAALDVVHRGYEFVLCELQSVRAGDQRQQTLLVDEVVHDQDFVVTLRSTELPALQGVSTGDGQSDAGGRCRGTTDGDTSTNQCADHREETTVRVLDRRAVRAVLGDVGVTVE